MKSTKNTNRSNISSVQSWGDDEEKTLIQGMNQKSSSSSAVTKTSKISALEFKENDLEDNENKRNNESLMPSVVEKMVNSCKVLSEEINTRNSQQSILIQFSVKGNILQVYHSKFRSMKERDLEFRLDKLKLDPNSLVLQSDGLKVVFASPEDFYSLKEYIQDYKERHRPKNSLSKSSKLKAPMSASQQPASSSSLNKQPNIKPSPAHPRYVSPNKSVSIIRNAPDKKGSETKDSNPMKLFASPNKSRDTVTNRSHGVTPHRHFSPEAYRKNFAEVKDVTDTVKQMKQRSFTPYEGSKSNDDSIAMDISSPISTPTISRKIAIPVAVESADSVQDAVKTSPNPTAKTFGRKTLWSSLISGEPTTRINPESSFYAATKPEMVPPIVSPIKSKEIPSFETDHSELVTKKRKAPMTFYDIFDKGAAKQPKSVETSSTTSNSVLPTTYNSLLSPSKGWDNEVDDDDWITKSLPISAEALKGTKRLTTFYSTGSSSFPSTAKSSITTSTFPSLMTPSYVRTVFKGGIRNLGNSCYISTMMQVRHFSFLIYLH